MAPVSVAVRSTPDPRPVAPAVYRIQAGASLPGTIYGSLAVEWDGGALNVPVVLNVTASPALPPVLAAVVNAASQEPSSLAPGEIVSIFGMGIGAAPAGFALDTAGYCRQR